MSLVRLPFRIVIEDALGRRPFQVTIQPRQVDKPTHWFKTASDATAFADEVSRLEGWPIEDRRRGDEPPMAA
jgi:hypothetical protein